MNYYQDITPWKMDNLPVSVKEDNNHLGLIISGIREEGQNVDLKIQKARGALFKLLGLLTQISSQASYRVYICPRFRSRRAMTLRTNHLKSLATLWLSSPGTELPNPLTFHGSCKAPHRSHTSLFHIIWSNPHTKIFKIIKHLFSYGSSNSHTWSRPV